MGSRTKFLILMWLKRKGKGSPYEFWKEIRPDIRYDTVVKYFMELRKEGKIYVVGEEESSTRGWIKKKLYSVRGT